MSVRTLQNWQRAEPKKVGRPAHTDAERERVLALVERALHRQGWQAGWRPVHVELGDQAPVRLVQESTATLKKGHRARLRRGKLDYEGPGITKRSWYSGTQYTLDVWLAKPCGDENDGEPSHDFGVAISTGTKTKNVFDVLNFTCLDCVAGGDPY